MWSCVCLSLAVLLSLAVTPSSGWEQDELDLFDLVEEIGIEVNFYDLMHIKQDATSAEIRRAYRQLSLQLHPDKSEDPDAAEKFRKMVAVAEVLKDDVKREMYNLILIEGLPDWKQPLFYYRKMRKMGLAELAALLLVMASVAHYLFGWAVFAEKQIILQDLLSRKQKKDQRKSKRGKSGSMPGSQKLEAEVEMLTTQANASVPGFRDLLPMVLAKGLVNLLLCCWRLLRQKLERMLDRTANVVVGVEEEEEGEEEEEEGIKSSGKKMNHKDTCVIGYDPPGGDTVERTELADVPFHPRKKEGGVDAKGGSLETCSAKNASIEEVGADIVEQVRTEFSSTNAGMDEVKEIVSVPSRTKKANRGKAKANKIIDLHLAQAVTESSAVIEDLNSVQHTVVGTQGSNGIITATSNGRTRYHQPAVIAATELASNRRNEAKPLVEMGTMLPTSEADDPGTTEPPGKASESADACAFSTVVATKVTAESNSESSCEPGGVEFEWSQLQQKQLERALTKYPKYSADRWGNVARAVPGKSQEECIERCKQLYEEVKRKKTTTCNELGQPS